MKLSYTRLLPKLVFVLVPFIALACRKDKVECKSDGPITLYATDHEGYEVTMTYDAMGRITSSTLSPVDIYWGYIGDRMSTITWDGYPYGAIDSIAYNGNNAIIYEKWGAPGYERPMTIDENNYALTYQSTYPSATDVDAYYYYNSDAELDSVVDLVSGRVDRLFYSEGLLTQAVIYDSTGSEICQNDYLYNSDDRLARHVMTLSSGEVRTIMYVYNELGQLVKTTRNQSNPPYSGGIDEITYMQTGCGRLINLDPLNFYRFPYMKLPRVE